MHRCIERCVTVAVGLAGGFGMPGSNDIHEPGSGGVRPLFVTVRVERRMVLLDAVDLGVDCVRPAVNFHHVMASQRPPEFVDLFPDTFVPVLFGYRFVLILPDTVPERILRDRLGASDEHGQHQSLLRSQSQGLFGSPPHARNETRSPMRRPCTHDRSWRTRSTWRLSSPSPMQHQSAGSERTWPVAPRERRRR